MDIVRREDRESFITADGSSIRGSPAFLPGTPSARASPKRPCRREARRSRISSPSEEIYLFTDGSGRVRLGDAGRPVRAATAS
jgi:hypothetical protein